MAQQSPGYNAALHPLISTERMERKNGVKLRVKRAESYKQKRKESEERERETERENNRNQGKEMRKIKVMKVVEEKEGWRRMTQRREAKEECYVCVTSAVEESCLTAIRRLLNDNLPSSLRWLAFFLLLLFLFW